MKRTSYLLTLLTVMSVCLLPSPVFSQNVTLVKDINRFTNSTPSPFTARFSTFPVIGGVCFFSADDGIHGTELWRSDGTTAGTYLVKDILDGAQNGNPSEFAVMNDKLYFSAATNAGIRLFVSDGTAAGTVMLKDVASPFRLTAANNVLYFLSHGGGRLWKSDGTTDGTVMIKDFTVPGPGYNSAIVPYLVPAAGALYFPLILSNNVGVLAFSDGTSAGTVLVNTSAIAPEHITEGTGNKVYFTALNGQDNVRRLWVADNQTGDAAIAAGFNEISISPSCPVAKKGNTLYFAGLAHGNIGASVYAYDMNASSGITLVKDITPPGISSAINQLTEVGGNLYFSARIYKDAIQWKDQLWRCDGTSAGTYLLVDSCSTMNLSRAGSNVYFWASTPATGFEPWKSDGTVAGTVMIKDIFPGPPLSAFSGVGFTWLNNSALFTAYNGINGYELWKSNGTAAGTALLKDINTTTTGSSGIFSPVELQGKLVFGASDGTTPFVKLWASDGTEAGTKRFADKHVSGILQQPGFARLGNYLFFDGTDSLTNRRGLFKFNGNSSTLVKDFTDSISLNTRFIIAADNLVYFCMQDAYTSLFSLWRSDGSAGGTFSLANAITELPGPTAQGRAPVIAGGRLFYLQRNITGQHALWKTDGTLEGTRPATGAFQAFDPSFNSLCAYSGEVYFTAFANGVKQLWKTNGTAGGTVVVNNTVTEFLNPSTAGGWLYFAGTSQGSTTGLELWKTNGTSAGTQLVKDIADGGNSSNPAMLANVNGTLYFFAGTPANGFELWKSDGTGDGTVMVKDITPGSASSSPRQVLAMANAGKMFMLVNNALWVSDGTATGTKPAEGAALASLVNPQQLATAGSRIFFKAYSYAYGEELYSAGVEPVFLPVYTFTGNGNFEDADNWVNGAMPPLEIPAGVEVIINPSAGSECIIRSPVVLKGGKLTVKQNAKLTLLLP
ncbi:ELWxxDGT repeat protein [Foetidibacter luteolus]|uniref:ELWxxDGT repeat protein n=1 Tax=Foetidibacter luteolus TaxID=2608880 RepID=UPI00129BA24C|nr:ELWxxDGT repeat protein [Foetidibacter luteolus]